MDMDRSCPFVFLYFILHDTKAWLSRLKGPIQELGCGGGRGWLCICELLEKVLAFACAYRGVWEEHFTHT